MMEAGWGRIVMISSSSAQRGSPGMAHYAASKGALISLTKSLAREYGPAGITVNNIPPSGIETPMQHAGPGAGHLPPNEQMAASIPLGHLGTGRRHRRRGRLPVLRGGRVHHRPDPRRQRRVGDVIDVRSVEVRNQHREVRMAKWPKPAEGSWTEHYPELGTGPVSFRDSTSPEFYELEREAVFKRAWLNVARVEEVPRVGSYLTKEIDAARSVGDRGEGQGRADPRVLQHLPSSRKQAGVERLSQRGGQGHLPPVHLQVPRVALRPRR